MLLTVEQAMQFLIRPQDGRKVLQNRAVTLKKRGLCVFLFVSFDSPFFSLFFYTSALIDEHMHTTNIHVHPLKRNMQVSQSSHTQPTSTPSSSANLERCMRTKQLACMLTHTWPVQDTLLHTYFYRWGEDTATSGYPGSNFHCSPLYPPCRREGSEWWRRMAAWHLQYWQLRSVIKIKAMKKRCKWFLFFCLSFTVSKCCVHSSGWHIRSGSSYPLDESVFKGESIQD